MTAGLGSANSARDRQKALGVAPARVVAAKNGKPVRRGGEQLQRVRVDPADGLLDARNVVGFGELQERPGPRAATRPIRDVVEDQRDK
jgi:hypothetical protein